MASGPVSARDDQAPTKSRTANALTVPSLTAPQPDPRRAVRPKKKGIEDHGLLSVLGNPKDKRQAAGESALDAELREAIQGHPPAEARKQAKDELLERSTDDLEPTHRRASTLGSDDPSVTPRQVSRYGEDVTRWSGPKEIQLRAEPLPSGPRPAYGADEIKRQIRAHKDQIQYCYERELSRRSTFSGQLILEGEVGLDGQLTSLEVAADTLQSAPLTQCLERRVRTWTFPPPKSGQPTQARIPILF